MKPYEGLRIPVTDRLNQLPKMPRGMTPRKGTEMKVISTGDEGLVDLQFVPEKRDRRTPKVVLSATREIMNELLSDTAL